MRDPVTNALVKMGLVCAKCMARKECIAIAPPSLCGCSPLAGMVFVWVDAPSPFCFIRSNCAPSRFCFIRSNSSP